MRAVQLFVPVKDRLWCLGYLINKVLDCDLVRKIHLVDMASSYPPMIEMLNHASKHPKIRVHKKQNLGSRGIFLTGFARSRLGASERFLLSDPDTTPVNDVRLCIEKMHKVLDQRPGTAKVGCSLKIDDIPDHFTRKKHVVDWEQKYWKKEISTNVYRGDVATTFCMIRSINSIDEYGDGPAVRIGPPYHAWHFSWYLDPKDLPDDEKWYYTHTRARGRKNPRPGTSWRFDEYP